MNRTTLVAALGLSFLATSCFQAIQIGEAPRVSPEWRRTLYDLEMFEYEPVDAGTSLFIPKGKFIPAGGMVVTVTRDRTIRAMAGVDGKDLWQVRTGSINVAKPVDIGEDLVVGSMDGHVYRLHKRNGRVIWKSPLPEGEGVTASPVLFGKAKRIVTTSIGNRVVALNAETGKPIWDKRRPHVGEFTISGQAGPLKLDDETVVTGFSDGRLVAFAIEDGATLWSSDLREGKTQFVDVDTTPQLLDKGPEGKPLIVAASYAVGMFGIDAESGDVEWLVRGEGYVTPALMGNMIYTSQPTGHVVAIDAMKGTVKWRHKVDIGAPVAPTATRKYLLVPNSEGLLLLRRETGRPISMIRDSRGFSGTPEFAYGTLYAIANSGVFYALSLY